MAEIPPKDPVNGSKYKMDDPLYLHSSDHSSMVLVSDLLTGAGFMNSPLIKQTLSLACKGIIIALLQEENTFKQCVKVNATLISCILNAMSKDLARGFAYATDAYILWEEIKVQYDGCVGPRLYEIKRAIYSVKQGKDSIAGFYNKIKGSQILLYGPIPNLAKTYGMISNVEKQKRLNVLDPLDVSAMQPAVRQFNKKIKRIMTDNGAEFLHIDFQNLISSQEILNSKSCVYTPQQNGVVEMKYQHLL
ncbi:hypothetical protein LIER_33558 [Lithospermum erythrorhizon]|uniref:Integrase catalytic domain-containing protein n=1 Tax=Lithospermum erythrorhizon TaxID=34254 RepID=A0AAV3S0A3_LITER